MKPSEVVTICRQANVAAARVGATFKLDERRLEGFGCSQEQIDGIYAELEWIDNMEREFRLRLARLDARC
jgi:hypothetical protein